jgi:anti-sigma regulatory factor (Ser/Thr protein kinase)
VSTLLCQVQRRLPVAVVDLYGTFDESSAVNGLISLRDCLAEQPMALVLDVTYLSMVGQHALNWLLELAGTSARWPGARVALCGAAESLRGMVKAAPAGDQVDLFEAVPDAVAAVLRSPVPPRESIQLAADRFAPEKARQVAERACLEWRVPRLRQLAKVIVSELVTNAVVHAQTPMEVTVRLVDHTLHLAVRDGDPRLLVDPGGGVAADGNGYGRGLLIVDSMADTWGCEPTGNGKVVWACLRVPEQASTDQQ